MKHLKLSHDDIAGFCNALGQLCHAGIGTGDAFALMAEDESAGAWHALLVQMARQADGGLPLAKIVGEAGCFPAYVCGLLAVGEEVGKTEATLFALARYYEGRARMERRMRDALLYPSVLLAVLLAVVVVLLAWVLPIFDDVYAQLGSRLTGVAGGLLAFGTLLRRLLPVLCIVLAAVIVCVIVGAVVPPVRNWVGAFWRRRRADRGTSRQINEARFAQALSMGLSSGMNTSEAVGLAISLTPGADAFRARTGRCLASVDEGRSLAAALREESLLSRADCRLLEAGIRSGSGEAVLGQIAARMLESSEAALEARVGRLEPTLVVVMSLLVGAILLSVMLPLINIMTLIG